MVIKESEFAKNFGGFSTPDELVRLLNFQSEISKENIYSDGFELIVETEKGGLKTYSEDKIFLTSILEFANADYTGSTYAFWIQSAYANISQTPIVAFGSEGGFHVVAENIREFLQILTFDSEPMIDWDEISFYKDEKNHEPSEYAEVYKNWLREKFDLESVENPDLIVEKAQEKFQTKFHDWVNQFYKEQ